MNIPTYIKAEIQSVASVAKNLEAKAVAEGREAEASLHRFYREHCERIVQEAEDEVKALPGQVVHAAEAVANEAEHLAGKVVDIAREI